MDELTISNLDALGYHCEIGEQNAGIQLDALGKFLRYVAREAEKTNKELSDASTRVPLEDYLKVAGVAADSADMLDIPSWFDIPEAILATQQRLEVIEKQNAELNFNLQSAQIDIRRMSEHNAKQADRIRELESVLNYWLHRARFLVGNTEEYNLAVKSLEAGKLQDGIEP